MDEVAKAAKIGDDDVSAICKAGPGFARSRRGR